MVKQKMFVHSFFVYLRIDTAKTKSDLLGVKTVINAKKIWRKTEAKLRSDERKYFGKFNPSAMRKILQCTERQLIRWAMYNYLFAKIYVDRRSDIL